MLTVDFSDRQKSLRVDIPRCRHMLTELLTREGISNGEISVSIVDDHEMHRLNRQYLDHDYPTDVLSFVFDRRDDLLLGEIIVSADTAIARCVEFGWSAWDEVSLYLLHGALHLVGYNDKTQVDCERMRERERHYLQQFGITVPACSCAPGQQGQTSTANPVAKDLGE